MREKERQILQLIKENPFIQQQELAKRTGLSRPAVANYISSLMKKGEIIGRAYILKEEGTILCIGGANVDKKIVFREKMEWHTSNPVRSFKAMGGVARNVAENLGRLGVKAQLLTAVGEDSDAKWLLEGSAQWMDPSISITIPSANTGTYTAILDQDGELVLALADMDLYDSIQFSMILERWNFIRAASLVFMDTNFPKDVLSAVIEKCRNERIRLAVNLVSVPKARKLPDRLEGVELILANRDEVAAAAGVATGDWRRAAGLLMERGASAVLVTKGKEGLSYFSDRDGCGNLPALITAVSDVTGAGDALAAGVLFGLHFGMDLKNACQFGQVCSHITLQSDESVSALLNRKRAEELFRRWKDGKTLKE